MRFSLILLPKTTNNAQTCGVDNNDMTAYALGYYRHLGRYPVQIGTGRDALIPPVVIVPVACFKPAAASEVVIGKKFFAHCDNVLCAPCAAADRTDATVFAQYRIAVSSVMQFVKSDTA